jgi:hypothetical protein
MLAKRSQTDSKKHFPLWKFCHNMESIPQAALTRGLPRMTEAQHGASPFISPGVA